MVNARKAWVFARGETWNVGWYEPDGKKRQQSFGTKKTDANNFCKVKTSELIQGISGSRSQSWSGFVADFNARKSASLRPSSSEAYQNAIAHFERICAPKQIGDISTAMVDKFTATRMAERGKKVGSKTSPATVNKELRALKRMLRVAVDWKLLRECPKIEFVKEPKVGITFVSADEFSALYTACNAATRPRLHKVDTADWWRGLLLFTYMTGWRISEPLALTWEDIDLEAGYAITRAGDNKSGKESRVPLHLLVVEHLKKLKGDSPVVFNWPHDEKQLWPELHRIQKASGIKKVCRKDHIHDAACERFGFHDLRRGFATANAANLSASQLQIMMRHSSYQTTQLYINMAEQVKQSDVASRLAVPRLRIATERSK